LKEDITWAPHLFNWLGDTFVRQQFTWNNQIQTRVFVLTEPEKATKYVATIKVSKVVGNTSRIVVSAIELFFLVFSSGALKRID